MYQNRDVGLPPVLTNTKTFRQVGSQELGPWNRKVEIGTSPGGGTVAQIELGKSDYPTPFSVGSVKRPTSIYSACDPEDAKWAFMAQMEKVAGPYGASTVIPGVGLVTTPQEYYDYAARKTKRAFLREFKSYIWSQLDFSTPTKRQFWETRFPEFTQDFYREYENLLDLQKRVAYVNLHGIQNEADLMLKYFWESGKFNSGDAIICADLPPFLYNAGVAQVPPRYPTIPNPDIIPPATNTIQGTGDPANYASQPIYRAPAQAPPQAPPPVNPPPNNNNNA